MSPASRRRGSGGSRTNPQIKTADAQAAQTLATSGDGPRVAEHRGDLDERAGDLVGESLEVKQRLAGDPSGQTRGREQADLRVVADQGEPDDPGEDQDRHGQHRPAEGPPAPTQAQVDDRRRDEADPDVPGQDARGQDESQNDPGTHPTATAGPDRGEHGEQLPDACKAAPTGSPPRPVPRSSSAPAPVPGSRPAAAGRASGTSDRPAGPRPPCRRRRRREPPRPSGRRPARAVPGRPDNPGESGHAGENPARRSRGNRGPRPGPRRARRIPPRRNAGGTRGRCSGRPMPLRRPPGGCTDQGSSRGPSEDRLMRLSFPASDGRIARTTSRSRRASTRLRCSPMLSLHHR